jgi:hypothetical protein
MGEGKVDYLEGKSLFPCGFGSEADGQSLDSAADRGSPMRRTAAMPHSGLNDGTCIALRVIVPRKGNCDGAMCFSKTKASISNTTRPPAAARHRSFPQSRGETHPVQEPLKL